MSKKKRVFWNFIATDYKAMEEFLENMARKGWMLKKIGALSGAAIFEKIPPSNIKFYVDVFKDGGPLVPENILDVKEYRSLCEDAGWHFITSQDYLQFFYAEEGVEPIPIQTDGEMERKLVIKTMLKGELIHLVLIVFILREILYELFFIPHMFFINTPRMIMGISLIIFIISSIGKLGYFLIWVIRTRGKLKGSNTLEPPNLKAARLRALIFDGVKVSAMWIVVVFMLIDARARINEIAFILIIVAMSVGLAGLSRFIIKKKGKRKDDGLYFSFIGAFIVFVFLFIVIYSLSGVLMDRDYKEEIIIPKDYPIVDVEELLGARQMEEPWYDFNSDSSYFIPLSYNAKGGISGYYLGITYYRSKEDSFSKLVFKGQVNTLKRYFRSFRKYRIEVEKVKEDEELREKWQADQLIIGERENSIVIRKGKYVLGIESLKLDFHNEDLIEYFSNIYFVH